MKPGYKTTEFVLALLVAALGGVAGCDALKTHSVAAQIVGFAAATLSSMFYAWTRMNLKTTEVKALAFQPAALPPATDAKDGAL